MYTFLKLKNWDSPNFFSVSKMYMMSICELFWIGVEGDFSFLEGLSFGENTLFSFSIGELALIILERVGSKVTV